MSVYWITVSESPFDRPVSNHSFILSNIQRLAVRRCRKYKGNCPKMLSNLAEGARCIHNKREKSAVLLYHPQNDSNPPPNAVISTEISEQGGYQNLDLARNLEIHHICNSKLLSHPSLPSTAPAKLYKELTSPKHCSLRPIHRQHHTRPETDALREIHAAPEIHGQQPATERQTVDIKHRCVANVRQAAEMLVLEGLVDSFVKPIVVDLIGAHARKSGGYFVEFRAQVHALLVRPLGCGGEGGQFRVNLPEEFVEFVKVEGSAAVFVVLFEETV